MDSLGQFIGGFKIFLTGVQWLRSRPKLFMFSFLPLVLGVVVAVSLLWAFINNFNSWLDFVLFDQPDTGIMLIIYYLAYASSVVGILLLCFLIGFLLPSVIASPFYDYVSMKVEEDVTGNKAVEISFLKSFLLIYEEAKKAVLIIAISLVALFIPFLNIAVPAWMLSWESYDYPLARRGLSLKQRLSYVSRDFWSIAGMAVWFVVPIVQFLLLPLAVAGGTMLALRNIDQ